MKLLFLYFLALLRISRAQTNSSDTNAFSISELPACSLSSLELRELSNDENVEPCILADIQPVVKASNHSAVLTLVHITNENCANHRDGAFVGVSTLNQGQGVPIGFHHDFFVKFRLVTVFAGNTNALGTEAYNARHQALLKDALETLQPHYIVGTCSPIAANERELAKEYNTILMAAVGPPGFYTAQENPWLFGMHINSDSYTLPSVQQLTFWADKQEAPYNLANLPVKVIYREESEFFYSTCRAAIEALSDAGFENVQEFLYDHTADADGDGVPNQIDKDFLYDLADQACPVDEPHQALFLCTLDEQNAILDRMRERGCQPLSLWLTASTWTWALQNMDQVGFYQGGSQWHPSMKYKDQFFDSGAQILSKVEQEFGYKADYNAVVHYAIPVLFGQHLQSAYRIRDNPNPVADFSDPVKRENLRRRLIAYSGDTIFGPISFDENHRNNGRGAAGSQWLLDLGTNSTLENRLVSPLLQAEASTTLPSPNSIPCPPGQYVNQSRIQSEPALLNSKCAECPVDTLTFEANELFSCLPCPSGSSTQGKTGSTQCVAYDDNLLTGGILSFGYIVMCISWILGISFPVWVYKHREDPVVRLAQTPYLLLICAGAVISSSTIILLGFQAGTDESATAATRACRAVPFLYTIGWALQYGSLSSKTFRLYKMMNNNHLRVKVTAWQTAPIVATSVILDIILVFIWTMVNPLEYRREITSQEMGSDHVLTISSVGQCSASQDGADAWIFMLPIIIHHMLLMIGTNYLLYHVRNVSSRYQEQKFIALAALFVLEVVVIGIPVLVAARDSAEATYVVQVGIVGLADIGVLCFMFVPKIIFQAKGLEAGVGVGESVMAKTAKQAKSRERMRSSFLANSMMLGNSISEPSAALKSSSDPEQPCGEQTREGLVHCIPEGNEDSDHSRRKTKGEKDVLGSKASWAGLNTSTFDHDSSLTRADGSRKLVESTGEWGGISTSTVVIDPDEDDKRADILNDLEAATNAGPPQRKDGEMWAANVISRLTQGSSSSCSSDSSDNKSGSDDPANLLVESAPQSRLVESQAGQPEDDSRPSDKASVTKPDNPTVFTPTKQGKVQERLDHMRSRVKTVRKSSALEDAPLTVADPPPDVYFM